MASHRHARAAGVLRHEISRIVDCELKDPAIAAVRVSNVVLAPDKCTVLVRVAPWEPDHQACPDQEPLRALERSAGFIRKALARALRMRQVPDLRFEYDRGERNAQRIETLLKRIKKRARKGATALLAWAALQSGTGQAAPLERLEASAAVMGSEFRIACYAPAKKLAAGALTAAFDEVRRVDGFLSHYKPDSELSRINREAARREVRVSEEMAELLADCLRYTAASDGAFDIAVGALVAAWGFHGGDGTLPGRWTLWRARRNTGSQHLRLDRAKRTVRFLRSGLRLDPGGIGKGYAVDRAVAILREFGIQRALVSSGTSSIFALGTPPDAPEGWGLAIRAPTGPRAQVDFVTLADEAISTSGNYEKYFEKDGRRYGHILDPRSGEPAAGVAAVSVVAPTASASEAWSTALVVNGAEWARRHPVPNGSVFLCHTADNCEWLRGR